MDARGRAKSLVRYGIRTRGKFEGEKANRGKRKGSRDGGREEEGRRKGTERKDKGWRECGKG